ncbi:MAG: hypothetical protein OXF85_00890 [Candidatus Saccharibacteria bacterium]|nr:hypothetical protein [Candidatus Saccharibacteria bacterium]
MDKLFRLLFKWLGVVDTQPRFDSNKISVQYQQPFIRNTRNQKLINFWWHRIFYNDANLRSLTNGYPTRSREGYGLIYYYLINNQLRYIGQTKEGCLNWRMTKNQSSGRTGYAYIMKRNLLNAYRLGRLAIRTAEIPIKNLDEMEKSEIERYAPTCRLWNQKHNTYYRHQNRLF